MAAGAPQPLRLREHFSNVRVGLSMGRIGCEPGLKGSTALAVDFAGLFLQPPFDRSVMVVTVGASSSILVVMPTSSPALEQSSPIA